MSATRTVVAVLGVFALLSAPLVAQADPPAVPGSDAPRRSSGLTWEKLDKAKFIRVKRDADGAPAALETSVVRFVPFDERSDVEHVDLVGVVHVGEKAYFDAINRALSDYDVVLFELAHKDDPRDRMRARARGTRRRNPLAALLNPGAMLGLESQMDHVDYDRKHFVHADTSLLDAMERRGDDWISLAAGLIADMRRQSNRGTFGGAGGADPLGGGLFGLGSMDPAELRRTMAEQLASEAMEGMAGLTTLNEVLISERNKVAMERLAEQLKAGKRRIAIFYGAGHMRDFTVRLVVDQGLRPTLIAWMEAWDLTKKPKARDRRRRGGASDREAAHDMLDDIYDMLEQLMKEPDPPARRPRRRGR